MVMLLQTLGRYYCTVRYKYRNESRAQVKFTESNNNAVPGLNAPLMDKCYRFDIISNLFPQLLFSRSLDHRGQGSLGGPASTRLVVFWERISYNYMIKANGFKCSCNTLTLPLNLSLACFLLCRSHEWHMGYSNGFVMFARALWSFFFHRSLSCKPLQVNLVHLQQLESSTKYAEPNLP